MVYGCFTTPSLFHGSSLGKRVIIAQAVLSLFSSDNHFFKKLIAAIINLFKGLFTYYVSRERGGGGGSQKMTIADEGGYGQKLVSDIGI